MKKKHQYLRAVLSSATLTITVVAGQTFLLSSTVQAQTAPIVNLPAPSIIDSGSNVIFSAANGNAVSIQHNGTATVVVELSVDAAIGSLLVNDTSGLVTVQNDNSANVTLIGQEADINAALDGLALTVAPGHDCSDGLALDVKLKSFADAGFINGGFEDPVINSDFVQINESTVPGWDTSAGDSKIEIWRDGFKGVPAHTGDQFAEINATQVAALSHSLTPITGTTELMFTFAHRGRAGIDTTAVIATDLGADGIIGGVDDTLLFSQQFTTDNIAWSQHYVQLGAVTGNTIFLRFDSISAAGGSSNGNFIDSVDIFDTPIITQGAIDLFFDNDNDLVANGADLDDDNDGVLDIDDNNGVNVCDLDSDNDGISDLIESSSGASAFDSNGDGIYDGPVDANGVPVDANGGMLVDTDGDGINDHQDLDSDNDGLTDTVEAGGTDANGDGIIDGFSDLDGDGWDDATQASNLPTGDFDADGAPDYLDIDSDDDGLTDTNEAGGTDADGDGVVDSFTDADGDGLDDSTAAAPLPLEDADGDGQADHLDVPAIPVAANDSATVAANTVASIDLSDNVSDPDGDVNVATIDLDPSTPGIQNTLTTADGVWSVDPAGDLSFDPAPAFEGVASIPYTVSDAAGNVSLPANVSVTVAGATPVATADSTTTPADTATTVALADNVSDANNDVDLTTIDLDPATPGIQSALSTADGDWSVDPAGVVTFDPTPGFEGTVTIPYVVSDDDGNTSAPADVSVTVAGATPVATADSATTPADTSVTVALADNVSDANNDVDITTIDLDPSTPGVQTSRTTANGTWSVDASGVVTFDPVPGFAGTATIPYVVSDDDGNVSAPANVTVTVLSATPVATADSAITPADTSATIALLDNVSDPNNDVDIATIDLDPTTPGIQDTLSTAEGDWSVDSVGVVTFDPAPGFEGTATAPYVVSDDEGNVSAPASVSVIVEGATPIATADSISTPADTNVTVALADNVSDDNNDVDITTIDLDPTTPGVQNTLSTAEGDWSVDPAGVVTFDPAPGFEGTASIPYVVADDDGNVSAPADISVVVGGAGPTVTADSTTVAAGTIATVDLADNNSDPNNDVALATLDLDPSTPGVQSIITTPEGVWSVDAAGLVSFDPDPAFEGTATVPYTVSDDDGNVAVPSTVSVTVGGATPVATDDSLAVLTGSTGAVDLSDNISDDNNDEDVATIDLDPATAGQQTTLTTADGTWDIDPAGMLSFTPSPGFQGVAVLDYTVSDDDGNVSDPAAVTVSVGSAAPIADGEAETTVQDTPVTIDVLDGDMDANNDIDPATIDLDPATTGIQDTLTVAGEGSYSVVGGQLVFDPEVGFTGISTLDYTVSDAAGNVSNIATVEVDVLLDSDGDGIADIDDLDDDNDGIPDLMEGTGDTDGDGLPDSLDLDSDNDGLTDSVEAGGGDVDGDGIIDGFTDLDGDGLDDATAAAPLPVGDTDGDGNADYVDVDSDNDGMTDTAEAGGADVDGDGIVDGFTDTDGDGLDDVTAVTPLPDPDSDVDGTPDHLDIDSDNDGVTDATEAGLEDTDGDGHIDGFTDADGDGLDDNAAAVTPNGGIDTDSDGQPDHIDFDADGDGIPDSVEAVVDPLTGVAAVPVDTDGDGTPDFLELDSDNDSIPDEVEAGPAPATPVDTDGDGIPDFLEPDSDNDGIPDEVEAGVAPATPVDTDGDGTPDFLEPDSDNDGIPDEVEAGVAPATPVDTDGDGTPDFLEPDSDNDGIPDSIEAGPAPATPIDTDGDGVADFLELDSDNDGLPDAVEAGANPADPVDTDGDGTPDFLEPETPVVTPPAATPLDSDGDGILDSIEGTVDSDGDGVPDYLDIDSDNDGISDAFEQAGDTDADGVADFRDLDVDNDGIFDLIEARIGQVEVNLLDVDNDGIVDVSNPYGSNGMADIVETSVDSGAENYVLPDVDGDGVLDYRDLDSDNDGLLDTNESDHVDDNINGFIDTFASVRRTTLAVDTSGLAADAGGLPRNTDADGLADFRDPDSDNDGILDIAESFGPELDVNGDGMLDDFIDSDGDGVDDAWLILPEAPVDTDDDGLVDAIEIDADGDGITDLIESGGVDTDDTGTIDDFTDSDGDGVDDAVAVVPTDPTDSDRDGIPDFQELDSDNDGTSDLKESGGIDANGDGVADSIVSANAIIDTDGDGVPDYQEVDGAVVPDNTNSLTPTAAGEIITGIEGNGCAISPTLLSRSKGAQSIMQTKVDPTLPLISILALMGLSLRRRSVLITKKATKGVSVAALAITALFVGGCSNFGGDPGSIFNSDEELGGAQEVVDYDDSYNNEDRLSRGLYAVAGIGPSRMEPDTTQVEGWDPNDRVEPAGQITIGADLTKHLSVEAHSADLGSAGLSAPEAGQEGRINYHINGVSALLYAGGNRDRFRRQGLTAYGRVGYGELENKPIGDVPYRQAHSNHVLIGAGVEYMTPIGVGIRAEGISFDKDAKYAQLGLMYRTGRREDDDLPMLAQAPQPQPPTVAAASPVPVFNACDALSGVLEGVTFHTDSAGLTKDSMLILNDVANTLSSCAQTKIELSAHTDSVGADGYNLSLSRKRAITVVKYLANQGLSPNRFEARAFGETRPVASNDTTQGRAQNRRVELYAR